MIITREGAEDRATFAWAAFGGVGPVSGDAVLTDPPMADGDLQNGNERECKPL